MGWKNNIIPILQLGQLDLKDIKSLPRGHTASKIAELKLEPRYWVFNKNLCLVNTRYILMSGTSIVTHYPINKKYKMLYFYS